MNPPKVSHCANPDCDAEFKRMGEGKLSVRPANPKTTANRSQQKAVWLCASCAKRFEVQFDHSHQHFKLVPLGQVA